MSFHGDEKIDPCSGCVLEQYDPIDYDSWRAQEFKRAAVRPGETVIGKPQAGHQTNDGQSTFHRIVRRVLGL